MKITLGTGSALTLAALVVVMATYGHDLLVWVFGPPSVVMAEVHAAAPGGPTYDHGGLDELLAAHVDDAGWVDYAALRKDLAKLEAYTAGLANAPFDGLGRDEKLALLINAYNAFTLQLILEHYDAGKLKSINDIPKARRWDAKRWIIAGKRYSLNQIEHEQVRPKFKEPRIHWALVCAAYSCPPLRDEAYTGAKLERQLADQERYVHSHPRWARWDAAANTLWLTALYNWYGGDFEQVSGSVLKYAAPHVSGVEADDEPRLRWIDYDWRLNDISNKPQG